MIDAIACSEARATLRAEWARSLGARGLLDVAADQLRSAAAEADWPPPKDGSEPSDRIILIRMARLAIRSAVEVVDTKLAGLPTWATAQLPESHLNLVNAIGHAPDWPAVRAVLDDNRDLFNTPALTNSLEVLQALHPGDTALDMVIRVLSEIKQSDLDEYFDQQQALHTSRVLLQDWLVTETWSESADFYRAHKAALTTDECKRVLRDTDNELTSAV